MYLKQNFGLAWYFQIEPVEMKTSCKTLLFKVVGMNVISGTLNQFSESLLCKLLSIQLASVNMLLTAIPEVVNIFI